MSFSVKIFHALSQRVRISETGPGKHLHLILNVSNPGVSKCCSRSFKSIREIKTAEVPM